MLKILTWQKLQRSVGMILKTELHGLKHLSNLVCWKVTLAMARGLEQDDIYGLLQPKPFYDSMILECML